MKKVYTITAILILVFATFGLAIEYDFRNVNWGMSKEEVKSIETADEFLELEDGTYSYKATVASLDSYLFYEFVENKLASSGYMFLVEHSNKNRYIDDFHKLKTLLIKKYGEPAFNIIHWDNDLYKDSKQDYGLAVSIGHLEYLTRWETDKTTIRLDLYGDNYDIYLSLDYTSKEYEDLLNKADEEEDLSGL